MEKFNEITEEELVAPLAGAWIEMIIIYLLHMFTESLPSRERGLKYVFAYGMDKGL